MPGHSVLLVDDERFERKVYSDYLGAAGFEVETASSAEQAAQVLAERRFDVLVTDMILPGSDGLQLLTDAKRIDPEIEVVIITALELVDPAVRAMKSGASDYLVKPVTPEALQIAVQRCLSTRALLAENKALRSHLKLFETSQRVASILAREKLIPAALSAIVAECMGDAGALFERAENGRWSLAGTVEMERAPAEAILAAAEPKLAALRPDQPVTLFELERLQPKSASQQAVCIAVGDEQGLLAAACVLGEGALDRGRCRSAEFICRHLAFALRTVSQVKQAQDLAYIDDLTHLYNTRYLDMALDREISNASPFSVLFLDLDEFKLVNDRHGHLVGSKLLIEVGRILRGCVRDNDVVVRYGGDEYVIILTGMDSGGALKVGERVRRTMEEHEFLAREGSKLKITASIGIGSYPEHATTKSAILDLADRAMYRGKRSTRNVIYLASSDSPASERA